MIRVREEYKKKKIKNKPNDSGQKMHLFGKKGTLLIVLATLTLGKILYGKATEDEYTRIAIAQDKDGDEYEGTIPISSEGKVIGTVENGTIVFVDDKSGGTVKIRGIAEDGQMIQGSTNKRYIKGKGKIKTSELEKYSYIYRVKGVDDFLNVRKEPSLEEETKVGKLYEGELVIGQSPMDSDENNIDWIPILYETDKGFENAYISSDYVRMVGRVRGNELPQNVLSQEEEDIVLQQKRVNENGKVVGVDISDTTSPERLEKILTNPNAIPSKGYKQVRNLETGEMVLTEFNMSDLKGKIDYVIIKLGARGYGEKGKMVEYGDIFKSQAEVCEKLRIPYGFYFYSTARNEDEAEKEAEYIEHALAKLENRRYNVIPFALDSEAEAGHRTYKKDITDVLAYMFNKLEPITGKAMLYTMGANAATCSGERIVDLERLNAQVESGPVKLWLSSHRTPENTGVYGERYIADIENQGEITMKQTITGVSNEDAGLGKIDINIIDEEKYEKLIEDRLSELREEETVQEKNDKDEEKNKQEKSKREEKNEQAER